MPHTRWDDLPASVRAAVAEQAGEVLSASPAGAGSTCQLAEVLHTARGPVFCKGVQVDDGKAWMLRNEIRVNEQLTPGLAPALRWHVEVEGWLLAGFENIPGRHANLSPGSPDLDAVAAVLADMSSRLTPAPMPARPFAARWAGRIDPTVVDGCTLLHTDPTPRNMLVDGGRVRIVDWATPATGAAWLDAALTVPRLIRDGHTAEDAEEWARQIPAYAAAPPRHVTAFARALADLWWERHRRSPAPHRGPLAIAALTWADRRSDRMLALADKLTL